MPKNIKNALFWAAAITLIAGGISEYSTGSLSTAAIYLFADLDSEAEGEIAESKIERVGGRSNLAYDIKYYYTVNNALYRGTQVNFGLRTEYSSRIVKQYTVGTKVKVFYDSNWPSIAVLESTPVSFGVYVQVILVFCIFIFTFIVKYKTRPEHRLM